MVERLKIAVEKAHRSAQAKKAAVAFDPDSAPDATVTESAVEEIPADELAVDEPLVIADPWMSVPERRPNLKKMHRNHVVSLDKAHTAHIEFDRLRTRILRALRSNDWSRLAITSPTPGDGKTVVACNLATSFSRQQECRTLLIDMDLGAPRVARYMGLSSRGSIGDFVAGNDTPDDFLVRLGTNLIVALAGKGIANSADIYQSDAAGAVLNGLIERLRPDVVIFDLPPVLPSYGVLAFAPNFECLLLVAAAGKTRFSELSETEGLMAPATNILGVLLNKSDESEVMSYGYGESR